MTAARLGPARVAAERDQQHTEPGGGDREVPAPAQPLAEPALGEHHEQPEAEHERRLHDAQRREPQRDQLQDQAEDHQGGAAQPFLAAREPQQQRRVVVAFLPRVARLDHVAELEAHRGGDGAAEAGRNARGHHCRMLP